MLIADDPPVVRRIELGLHIEHLHRELCTAVHHCPLRALGCDFYAAGE